MLKRQRRGQRQLQGIQAIRAAAQTAIGFVFVVALLNGFAWSLLTPPFQVPDETAHFAYVQNIAENGTRAGRPGYPEASTEQTEAMTAMGTLGIIGRPIVHPPSNGQNADRALRRAADTASRDDGGGISSASGQPPLFYAASALVYRVFSWTTLPTRLHAMRGLSVIIFAVGAALCASIASNVLPSYRWAPLVGGLAIALSPYTTFIASGVTPDTLLLTVSAAVVLFITLACRDGLTLRRGVSLGLMLGAGAMTKLVFLAFLPPSFVIVLYLTVRDRDLYRTTAGAVKMFVVTVGAAAVIPLAVLLWSELAAGAAVSTTSSQIDQSIGIHRATNIKLVAVYAWELFLPKLPFMSEQFSYSPPLNTWVDGFAGRYGWLDYAASPSVTRLFRWVMLALALGVASAMFTARRAVLDRRVEVVSYGLLLVAVALVIGKTGYDYRQRTNYIFEQPRYLFSIAGIYSVIIATACLGLGRRAAPYIVTAVICLLCLHDIAGVTETMTRYYG